MNPISKYLRSLIHKNRQLIYAEAEFLDGFMHLLMKQRNTGSRWEREEKKLLKKYLRHLALMIPALLIFILPGGSLLLPFLAEVLDRRKKSRPVG